MHLAHQLLLLLHLVGFAALFGGVFIQIRSAEPEVNAAMLHGALTQVVSGVALLVLDELGPDPVNHVKITVKILIGLAVLVLVVANRKYASIPRGLWALIGGLTLGNAAIAVLWQ